VNVVNQYVAQPSQQEKSTPSTPSQGSLSPIDSLPSPPSSNFVNLFDSTLSDQITLGLETAQVHPQVPNRPILNFDCEMEAAAYNPGFFSGRDG
jgi:hypothetical protein